MSLSLATLVIILALSIVVTVFTLWIMDQTPYERDHWQWWVIAFAIIVVGNLVLQAIVFNY